MSKSEKAEVQRMLGGMTDDERDSYLGREKAERLERRRQSRTPRGIRWTNLKKRTGNLSYVISDDGAKIVVEARTNSQASSLVLHLLKAAGAKLY